MVTPPKFGKFARLTCLVSVMAWGNLRASAQDLAAPSAPPAPDEPAAQTEAEKPMPATPEKPTSEQPGISELEQLLTRPVHVPALQQEVTTVSRQVSSVGKSPAAVFVITNDMIRRSGATSVPEALRMAPGVNVARIDSNKWAVGIRGFNDRFAGKTLVQVDGRVIYNPISSGVYWDFQDVMLEDVERIEIIRGPGATVWGSNTLNGIINIITKNSKDTQGALVVAGGGTEEQGFTSARYGGNNDDDNLHYRVYGKWFERDNSFLPSGGSQLPPPSGGTPYTSAKDDWRKGQGGFRVDWEATEADAVKLQGDIFAVSSARGDFRPQRSPPMLMPPVFVFQNAEDEITTGGNLLTRWQHQTGDDSSWALQFYWDHFGRGTANSNNVTATHPVNVDNFHFRVDTYDLDFQHQFALTDRQKFIYGLGYRAQDTFFRGSVGDGGFVLDVNPEHRVLYRYSAFLQDEFKLVEDRLYFTAGSKFEHNTYAGFQYQPSGRVLWTPTERQSAWGAVSRAVRIPNVGEDALRITGFTPTAGTLVRTFPNPNLNAEDVMAYELGYRAQPSDEFSFDTAIFYNVYNNLIVSRFGRDVIGVPNFTEVMRANGMSAETYGVELSANWKLTETWRLQGNYTFLQMQLHRDPGIDASFENPEGQSPQNQVYVQSSWDLTKEVEFDLMGRYVDSLTSFPSLAPDRVPSYISMDARLGWRPNQNWELSVVGQNLLDSHHLEFGGNQFLSAPLVEMQRGVYAMAVWRH
jgi:iron complex outermembrane recepter protein